jgi:hypothetical protein
VTAIAASALIAGPAHSTPATDSTLCTPVRYRVGEGSVDEGVGHVHPIRNESGAAAETVAVQLVPVGATRRIDAPEPNNCNF